MRPAMIGRSAVLAWPLAIAASTFAADSPVQREWSVSVQGDDRNDGSSEHMLKTISAAAARAMPGDVVTVHAGVYRERVDPPRGGTADVRRIVYRAAPGERVEITGSEPVVGWSRAGAGKGHNADVWTVVIHNARFGAFNPFDDLIRGDWFDAKKRKHHTGAVYLNGDWLAEAPTKQAVFEPTPAGPTTRPGDTPTVPLWFAEVGAADTTVWAQFPGVDPNAQAVEVNARQSVFYPSKAGVNYITVRGFVLSRAATPWAPPTAEQVALIGTNWSRGWIIEDNEIRHSICCGISLGKYGDEFDNKSASSAGGYVKTIERALANGWTKDNVGHHVVRRNSISQCEQAGIVGSLGAAFSSVTDNDIHDIHVRRLFTGAEMAGIKFHAAIDTLIAGNHVYRCNRGLWLDWMNQGTRVTCNLFHDNAYPQDLIAAAIPGGRQDMFVEVNHGPFVIDNNLFLSSVSLNNRSQGTAYAHNLFAGKLVLVDYDKRVTPFHKPHSTEIAGSHDNPSGDVRLLNNVFIDAADLTPYDRPRLPVRSEGNVFVGNAKPTTQEVDPVLATAGASRVARVVERADGFYLELSPDPAWKAGRRRNVVTTGLLGNASVSGLPFENADGTPLRIDTDYFGRPRDAQDPVPGPFETLGLAEGSVKVWPLPARDWRASAP